MFIKNFDSIIHAYRVQCPMCGNVNIGSKEDFQPVHFFATKDIDKGIVVGYSFSCAHCKNDIKIFPTDLEDVELHLKE